MKYIIVGFILLFQLSCALQVAPTGGLKDETPPEIIEHEPANGTVNFQEDQIELTFNEFVKLSRFKEKFISSPPLEYSLQTTIRGKQLRLKIKDTLKENITYVFNFGNSLVDVHENNPIEDYSYVFSTGSSIDSGKISGKVVDAFSAKPLESIVVMAYEVPAEDSIPYKEKPDYVSLSREDGSFELKHMRLGRYKLFALKDANENYLYDRPTEEISFLDTLVESKLEADTLKFYLFLEDNEKQFVKEQNEVGPLTEFIFNLPVEEFHSSTELVDSISLEPLLVEQNNTKDTIKYWWPDMALRFPLILEADTLVDTVKVLIDTIRSSSRSQLKIENFGPHHYYQSPYLTFNYPISEIDTSKITLLDVDTFPMEFNLEATASARKLKFNYQAIQGLSYQLILDSAAFSDIYGHVSDSTAFNFSVDEESDYGSLVVKVNINTDFPLILELMDQNQKVLKTRFLDSTNRRAEFKYLSSGNYMLKLILDEDSSRTWTTGGYIVGKQAERVILYEGELRVKSRWEKEIEWRIKDN